MKKVMLSVTIGLTLAMFVGCGTESSEPKKLETSFSKIKGILDCDPNKGDDTPPLDLDEEPCNCGVNGPFICRRYPNRQDIGPGCDCVDGAPTCSSSGSGSENNPKP